MAKNPIIVRIPEEFHDVVFKENQDFFKGYVYEDNVFSVEFLTTHTNFKSFEDMINLSPITMFDFNSDHESLYCDEMNEFIKENTIYDDMSDMLGKAIEYGLGLEKYIEAQDRRNEEKCKNEQ